MNRHISGRRPILLFHVICFAVYFASYCTRINYGAAIIAVAADLGVAKNIASIASTGLFITYGTGQLISGFLGDRMPPHRLIFTGLFGASVINVCMGFASGIWPMIVLWCVNGFFQAMLWPPLVRIMSELLDTDDYKKAVITVSVGSTAATILIYLLVPLCITFSGWRLVFFLCAGLGAIVSAVWMVYIASLRRQSVYSGRPVRRAAASAAPSRIDTAYSFRHLVLLSGLIPIICAIILHGTLRDGVQTWMPAFIDETYHLGASISILTTVILPIFATLSYPVATWLKSRFGNSELNSAAFLFGLAAACSVLLLVFLDVSPVISIPLMAVVNGSMHGINMMLISHVPQRFAKYGCVSTVSGLLNSATYVGAAASTWGIALLSEARGWFFTIAVWAVIAAAGLTVCLMERGRWNRFLQK